MLGSIPEHEFWGGDGLSIGLKFSLVPDAEVLGFDATLEDGRRVILLPYARVKLDGSDYLLCTIAEEPESAVVMMKLGSDLVQVTGPLAQRLVDLARQYGK